MSKELLIKLPPDKKDREKKIGKVLELMLDTAKGNIFKVVKNIFTGSILKEIKTEELGGVLIFKITLDVIDQLYSEIYEGYGEDYDTFRKNLKQNIIEWIQKTNLELDNTFFRRIKASKILNKFKKFVDDKYQEYHFNIDNLSDKFNDVSDVLLKNKVFERLNSYANERLNDPLEYQTEINTLQLELEKYKSFNKTKFDIIRGLISEFKLKRADEEIREFEMLTKEKDDKYLLYILKGELFAVQGKIQESGEMYLEAAKYQDDEKEMLAAKAFGYISKEKRKSALLMIDKLFEHDPTSHNAILAEIHMCLDSIELDNCITEHEEVIGNNWNLNFAIANQYLKFKNFKDGEIYLKKIKEVNSDWFVEVELLRIQIVKYQEEYNKRGQSLSQNKELKELVEELKIKIDEHHENNYLKYQRVSLGIGYVLLGRENDAIKVFESLYDRFPEDFHVLYHYSFSLKQTGEFEKLEKILIPFIQEEVTQKDNYDNLNLIELYFSALEENNIGEKLSEVKKERNDRIITLGNSIFQRDPEYSEKILNVSVYITNSYANEGRFDEGIEFLDGRIKQYSDHKEVIGFNLLKISLYKRFKRTSDAISVLNRLEIDPDNIDYEIFDFMIDQVFKLGEFSKIVELADRRSSISPNISVEKMIIDSYANTGNTKKALKLCQKIYQNVGVIREIRDFEGRTYDYVGDLEKAIELYEEYIVRFPEDFSAYIHLATLKSRTNKNIEKEFLDSIPVKELTNYPDWNNLVLLYLHIGEYFSALQILYLLRFQLRGESKTHDLYLKIMMLYFREDFYERFLTHSKVENNVVVSIEDNQGEKFTYIIDDELPEKYRDTNILRSDHQLVKSLWSRKINETLTYSNKEYIIVDIQDKYIVAKNESIKLLNAPLYNIEGFQTIKIKNPEEDFKKIARDRKEYFEKVLMEYRQQPLITIGQLNNFLTMNTFETMNYLRRNQLGQLAFNISLGWDNLAQKKSLVLDLTAIFTFHLLDIQDKIKNNFNRLMISQSILDELDYMIWNTKGIFLSGFYQFGVDDENNLIGNKISGEENQKVIQELVRVKSWIQENCEVVPVYQILEFEDYSYPELSKALGRSSSDSILLAKQEESIFYCDDSRLLNAAGQLRDTPSELDFKSQETTDTLRIIKYLHHSKKITDSELKNLKIKLLENHYYAIDIDVDLLLECVNRSDWKVTPLFLSAIYPLNGVYYNEMKENGIKFTINLAVDFILELFRNTNEYEKTYKLIFEVLEQITKDSNDKELITNFLISQIEHREGSFKFETQEIIKFWFEHRILKEENNDTLMESLKGFQQSYHDFMSDDLFKKIVSIGLSGSQDEKINTVKALKDVLNKSKNEQERKKLLEFNQIIFDFIMNNGNIRQYQKHPYYSKLMIFSTEKNLFDISKKAVILRLSRDEEGITKMIKSLKGDIQMFQMNDLISNYLEMLTHFLETGMFSAYREKINNDTLFDMFSKLNTVIFSNDTIQMISDTIKITLNDEGHDAVALKEKINRFINAVKEYSEESIVRDEYLPMYNMLLDLLDGKSFREYRNELSKEQYFIFYMRWLHLKGEESDPVKSFIQEAKELKKEGNQDNINDLIYIMNLLQRDFHSITDQIYNIIIKYLRDEDITSYQDKLMYEQLVLELLDD